MSSYSVRVAKLEAHTNNPASNLAVGFMDYGSDGECTGLRLQGVRYARRADETEDAPRARAIVELGPFDQVLWVSFVAAKDGKPAPGFERFAMS